MLMNTGFIDGFKNIFGQVTLSHSSAIKKHLKRNKVRSFFLYLNSRIFKNRNENIWSPSLTAIESCGA